MIVYDIAIGTKRKNVQSTQYRWEWHQLVERLRKVEVCAHTMDAYQRFTKSQRTDAKDVGFFVGGMCQRRTVLYRQILSLDIDNGADEALLTTLRSWLKDKQYIIHSTHSSTPDAPRYRVVVPLSHLIHAEEHGAIMRILYDKFKMPLDVATFDFNRIMFLPSVPKDADYFFEANVDGEPLDVDALLAELENWRDLSTLDCKPKDSVQDPLTKGGIVGAFCQKYTIREAIDTFLQDVWRKESDGSYTLIGATTTSGGKIFEDKFLVSFHGSDVHLGKSHNAYDAVRLYRFSKDREKPDKVADAAMVQLCDSLGVVAESGRRAALTLDAMDDEEAKTILKDKLVFDKSGLLKPLISNVKLILEYDPEVRGVFAYDLFSEMPVLRRPPYWRTTQPPINEDCKNIRDYEEIEDVDESYFRTHLETKYEFTSRTVIEDALKISQHQNAFHPIRDYLDGLEWDGEERLSKIFIDCFGVHDTLYAREVGLKFFVGAVRRIFIPASKLDYIPVLVSKEGLGKTRFIRRMAKLWGSDSFYTFNGGKDAYEQVRGAWLMEIAELNGVQSRSTNSRKAFVTKSSDRYRSAYMKHIKTYKRQCAFIATENDTVFLNDPSEEGRRWWGMICHADRISVDIHSDEFLDRVDQYWAEAMHHFRLGVLPVLSDRAEAEANVQRQVHRAETFEAGALADYLLMPVPENWYDMTIFQRKDYWENQRSMWAGKPREVICGAEVAREFYGIERKDFSAQQGIKVGTAIRSTGLFEKTDTKKRFGEYGLSIVWTRKLK